jgi:hypothetical protein
MTKVDFHTHTSDDPSDWIPYSAAELIDRAADLGFGAIAITLHDQQWDFGDVAARARERGVILIPGVERTLQGKHVLLLNFPTAAEGIENFDELARLKARHPEGLIVAPHPFYPLSTCLRRVLTRHANLFDAVELNAFHTASLDFNRPALQWARAHGKPVVANSDAHRLSILGASFSLVDAEPDADAICEAVRAGRVQLESRPLSITEAGIYFGSLIVGNLGAFGTARPAADALAREER